MFGFVTAASELLSEEDKIRYRGWYCGLCRSLGKVSGQSSRLLLNYDMTFLAMLLSSVHRLPETSEECACAAHPLKKHLEIHTSASDYSADMSVILGYYKLLDDWHDDRNPAALAAASAFASKCRELEEKYPRQSQAISTCLENLSELEQDGECNPDLPANCFGRLRASFLSWTTAWNISRSFAPSDGRWADSYMCLTRRQTSAVISVTSATTASPERRRRKFIKRCRSWAAISCAAIRSCLSQPILK